MSEQWIWQAKGRSQRIVSTEELESLVLGNAIGETDRLRPVKSSEWLTGLALVALFDIEPTVSASESASQILSSANRRALHASAHERTPAGDRLRITRRLVETFVGLIEACGSLLDSVLDAIFSRRSLINRKSTLAIVTVGLLLVIVRIPYAREDYAELYRKMAHVADQIALLRADKTHQTWETLRSESNSWLPPAVIRLEAAMTAAPLARSAWWPGRGDRAATTRELLLAGKTLAAILAAERADELQLEDLRRHLTVSRRLIRGVRPTVRSSPPTGGKAAIFNIGIVVINVLVLASLFWWWRRPVRRIV